MPPSFGRPVRERSLSVGTRTDTQSRNVPDDRRATRSGRLARRGRHLPQSERSDPSGAPTITRAGTRDRRSSLASLGAETGENVPATRADPLTHQRTGRSVAARESSNDRSGNASIGVTVPVAFERYVEVPRQSRRHRSAPATGCCTLPVVLRRQYVQFVRRYKTGPRVLAWLFHVSLLPERSGPWITNVGTSILSVSSRPSHPQNAPVTVFQADRRRGIRFDLRKSSVTHFGVVS